MACDLTTGRAKSCFDNISGVKAVYFSTDALGAITYDITDTDVITTFAGLPEFFQFDLKGNANTFVETITKDVSNGTAFYDQVLTLQFPKLDKSTHKELKLLVWASPTVCIQDYNDNYFMMGLENGADITGGSVATGGARGDFAGYSLTMSGQEKVPANFLKVDLATTTATISAVQIAP